MATQHAVIGPFQLHYQFAGTDDCLIITSRTEAHGDLLLTWMLAWRPGEGFRVERLREDARHGIGAGEPASIKDFPLAEALRSLDALAAGIDPADHRQIHALLLQAQTASGASQFTANP